MVNFDEFGPEKIIQVYDPKSGMRGFTVIDNTALGPGKGGIRMTPTVSIDEVSRLARAMTWKCALAGLPFGGGKSGIIADPRKFPPAKKVEIVKAFANAIKIISPKHYVSAPDMNMAEEEMEIFAKENGSMKSCTGKPKKMGGIPHELGSTGFGVIKATLVALKHMKKDPKNMTFAVEGFGNVGWFAAKFMTEAGAKLIAATDSRGCVFDKNGIDFKKLAKVKKETGSVTNYKNGAKTCQDIVAADVDILITAAIPDLITHDNMNNIKAKLIVEGSNIPMTPEIEEKLHERGILVIPDFVANAGGVISSYVEYIGGDVKRMWKEVETKITSNTKKVLELSAKENCMPRKAAMKIAKERVSKKMK